MDHTVLPANYTAPASTLIFSSATDVAAGTVSAACLFVSFAS